MHLPVRDGLRFRWLVLLLIIRDNPWYPRLVSSESDLEKQKLKVHVSSGPGRCKGLNELNGFVIVALSPRARAAGRWNQRGAEICDQQRGLAKRREVFQPCHDFRAGEKRCGRCQGERRIPVIKSVIWYLAKQSGEKCSRSGIECGVKFRGELGVRFALGLQFGEAKRNCLFDLFGEIEVVARNPREERIDEMQAPQIIGRCDGHDVESWTRCRRAHAIVTSVGVSAECLNLVSAYPRH